MNRMLRPKVGFRRLTRHFTKYYDENHVWLTKVEGKDMYSLGLGSEGLKDIGTVRAVRFNDIDYIYAPGTTVVTIEGSKTTREVETPVRIYVERINQKVKDDYSKFVAAPEDVWLLWGELQDVTELNSLMTVDKYSEYVNSQKTSRRLKRGIPTHVYQGKQS